MHVPEAHAIPTLLVNGTGQLAGATGVDVGGSLYNVTFMDGTCIALFANCTTAGFTFQNEAMANDASQALSSTVFLDSALGFFDSQPERTQGCALYMSDPRCIIETPFAIQTNGEVKTFAFINYPIESSDITVLDTLAPSTDTSTELPRTWAVWAPQAVPESSSLLLLGSGLVMFLALSRKQLARSH